MDPILAAFIAALSVALPKLFELFSHLGSRDAFLAALDASLVATAAKWLVGFSDVTTSTPPSCSLARIASRFCAGKT